MTVKEMMTNEQRKEFIRWGITAKYYGVIGKLFRSMLYLDKSVYYLDKRWELMCDVLCKHGYQ